MHFRENLLIFLWILGEAELFLGICGATAYTFRETRTLFAGRPMHYFQGSREHRPPWGASLCIWHVFLYSINTNIYHFRSMKYRQYA